MTTSPVVGITDKLIAELEIFALYGEGTDSGIKASEVEALLAERADLKRDARRYKFLREEPCVDVRVNRHALSHEDLDAAIDSAMECEK